MSEDSELLDRLVTSVQATDKYHAIDPQLVRRIGSEQLRDLRSFKEAVKATRSRLHQVAAAYQEGGIDYGRWTAALENLPKKTNGPELKALCLQAMQQHASTRERLPYLETFFQKTLSGLEPIHSVLDLACGLNPLAISWMPLAADAVYYACDIYCDLVEFINHFFALTNQKGDVFTMDLVQEVPAQTVDLALLLKTLPCLEQLDKSTSSRLLDSIQARYLLVSFPARSLGGRAKGMVANYELHFRDLIAGRGWSYERYEFPTELAFLVKKETLQGTSGAVN